MKNIARSGGGGWRRGGGRGGGRGGERKLLTPLDLH
jgi:hypothetical protein